MNRINHGVVVLALMASVGGLLGWKSSQIAIVFADGLRYIHQAQLIDQGSLKDGLLGSVDHPLYPVSIAMAHRIIGGSTPEDWQSAATFVSVLCGILLVVPLYLVSAELFGGRVAWLSVALTYLSPVVVGVLADALSEGLFLLCWTTGLWTALRFLRDGHFAWLPPTIAASVAAYATRPEGLLLPAALAATLVALPFLKGAHLNWPRWWAAMAVMVIGPLLVVGPYVAYKGGLGTKPAIARILGTAPRSGAEAVERSRPLEADEPPSRTYAVAAKAAFEAVRDAATVPTLALGLAGAALCGLQRTDKRKALLLGLILAGCALALIRLQATGGYCSPRHALVPAMLVTSAAGLGLDRLLSSVKVKPRSADAARGAIRLGPIFWLIALAGVGAWNGKGLASPINKSFSAYRVAAEWLGPKMGPGEKIVDLTGWSQFYAGRQGYTFADAIYAGADQDARWVVAREAHMAGPWDYCDILRSLVGPLKPVAKLPANPERGEARVLVFDRRVRGEVALMGTPAGTVIR